jgi:anti-sigma factor RsiW
MMDFQEQLKLQSYLDGELSEPEAQEMASSLRSDPEAAALLNELRNTSQALNGCEQVLRVPETRDFYWSKIKREIERQEPPLRENATTVPWMVRLRRFLMPAAGLAVVSLLALVVTKESGSPESSVETSLADSGALVYHDFSAGATFVWLSYPADTEASEEDEGVFE